MPKISVIIAVYNVEPYLRRSMDCLTNQTMQDLEFICVDDCSTDNSLSILREYESKDSRFKIIALDKNQGAAVARNKGLEAAKGEYLGFIDPDDAIDLNYYEELYKNSNNGALDIVKCSRKTIELDGSSTFSNLNSIIKKRGIYGFSYEWTCAIYKTSELLKYNIRFNEEIIKAQDTVFLNKIILNFKTIAIIDNVYYYYYRRENSLNSDYLTLSKLKSNCNAFKAILSDINNAGVYDKDKEVYKYMYCGKFTSLFNVFYRNDTKEGKLYCIDTIIEYYKKCKDLDTLDKKIVNKSLLKAIKNNQAKEILKMLSEYENYRDFLLRHIFKHNYKGLEKIFSIKNFKTPNSNEKVLTILGKRFIIKKNITNINSENSICEEYVSNRKNFKYYKVVKNILKIFSSKKKSIIDVGSANVDLMSEFDFIKRVSVSLIGAINSSKVSGYEMDFFNYVPDKKFDVVTCLQCIEHVDRARDFTQKLLNTGKILVISLPYKWKKGRCKSHVQDPVDEAKIYSWVGKKPQFTFYVKDGNSWRIICVYGKFTIIQNLRLFWLNIKYKKYITKKNSYNNTFKLKKNDEIYKKNPE